MFTINNPTTAVEDQPRLWRFKYLIFQRERGAEGTEHLQGYVIFDTNRRLNGLKKVNSRAHWEYRQGSHEQAVAYCSKEDTRIEGPWILGEPPAPGQRNDLTLALADVRDGMSELELADKYGATWARNYRALSRFRTLISKPRNFKTRVTVVYGPTGTGKSRYCSQNYPSAYWKSEGSWYDDYEGHREVIFDEFNGTWFPWSVLLRLCDRYPMQVPVKGSFGNFVAKHVFFVSNQDPQTWYPNCYWPAFDRRIDDIIFVHYDGTAEVRRGSLDYPFIGQPSPDERGGAPRVVPADKPFSLFDSDSRVRLGLPVTSGSVRVPPAPSKEDEDFGSRSRLILPGHHVPSVLPCVPSPDPEDDVL